MDVRDLNREQLIELKQSYLTELDDEGILEEVAEIERISWDVLDNADELVPDDVIFNHYDGYMFTDDDF